jgi:cysteinyl-tRNA synthetase
MLKLFNTLGRTIQEFKPLNDKEVTLYTCGVTVYDYTHIGHLYKYVGDDILKRVLRANGFKVKHVMNVTDVGHLESDADEGGDKMEKGAAKAGKTVWEVAKFFEEYSWDSLAQINFEKPDIICRATEHIPQQIELIKKLEAKGFTYQTPQAIYFDVTKFSTYTQLSGQKLEDKEVGVREDVKVDPLKKHPADFALWFFTVGHFANHAMHWSSPWGEGFPGWHIECSAMSMEYLGKTIDILTGGVDHIPVHHTNEIAQSEAATGKKFVNFWIHHEHMMIDGEKMSKSKGNFYKVEDIIAKGFDPLALRYLFLTAHYKDQMNFTWESLQAAQNALNKLREEIRTWPAFAKASSGDNRLSEEAKSETTHFYHKFLESANNDLNTPQAVAVMWEMVRSGTPTSSEQSSSANKSADLLAMDKILGLDLEKYLGKPLEIPDEVRQLVEQREEARQNKEFNRSDDLRSAIYEKGYEVEDTASGPRVKKL